MRDLRFIPVVDYVTRDNGTDRCLALMCGCFLPNELIMRNRTVNANQAMKRRFRSPGCTEGAFAKSYRINTTG